MTDEQASRRLGRVVGKYTLERIIGSGGMATVYEASHSNGHRVALKMLKPMHAVGSEVRARFLREGYAANKVRHPGAVRVLDDDVTDDGLVFLVMEHLEGVTLDAHARACGGRLPLKLVLEVGKQLLDVLAAAHEAGIVHRDVKPENVFLQANGRLKVLDFGIARISSGRHATSTTTGRMLGTPAFMPPEQAYGRRAEVDARSDLWSVGATLFTALTGRVVHRADTAEETLIMAATESAPSLASALDEVPAPVAHLVDRALMAVKADRWSSAEEMRTALERAHDEVFGGLVASVISFGATAAATPTETAERRTSTRVARLVAWGAPCALLVALLISATAKRQVSRPVVVSEAAPAATGIAHPNPHTVTAQIAEERDLAAATVLGATAAQPSASAADQRARPAVARIRSAARPPSTAVPAVLTSASAPSVTVPSSVCGFDFDEEGRKWPKRCP